jgi:hypothetical protein
MQFVYTDTHGLRLIQRIGGGVSKNDLRSLLSPWPAGFNAYNHGKQSVLLKFLMTHLCLHHAGRSIVDLESAMLAVTKLLQQIAGCQEPSFTGLTPFVGNYQAAIESRRLPGIGSFIKYENHGVPQNTLTLPG